jgi:hypothetical protein
VDNFVDKRAAPARMARNDAVGFALLKISSQEEIAGAIVRRFPYTRPKDELATHERADSDHTFPNSLSALQLRHAA